ncbi:sugar kinase [Spongiibacter sp. KMU-158]|uniref:Sugar kinase n=1 Tax=Spongiibacter pelagi TaxID=2760804 RepID=A0A927C3D7_9GAMM|nr:sugar kinase [Spongiibacter pelagi]MBD2859418.1 sugar kinase [Spongiibacter pelagi]
MSDKVMPRFLALGEVMIELAPGSGQAGFDLGFAGDTYNTAIHLARLGAEVAYLTEIGADKFSDAIVIMGEANGLDMKACVRTQGELPGLYLIENDQRGERQFYYWRDNSAARQLFNSDNKLQHLLDTVQEGDVVYLSGITLAVMDGDIEGRFWTFIQQIKHRDITLVFDPNYRPRLWPDLEKARTAYKKLIALCDAALPTLDDEIALWGFDNTEEVLRFYRELGVAEVVLKLPDAQAMAVFEGQCVSRKSVYSGPVIDTTGAGDAFNAGYLFARFSGMDLSAALEMGHQMAAKVIAVRGALPKRGDAAEGEVNY